MHKLLSQGTYMAPATARPKSAQPACALWLVIDCLLRCKLAACVPCMHKCTCSTPARAPTYLCDIVFFMSLSISAYVVSKPSGWNTGSHPKSAGPRAGTMLPSVRPTKVMGSASGPAPPAAAQPCFERQMVPKASRASRRRVALGTPLLPTAYHIKCQAQTACDGRPITVSERVGMMPQPCPCPASRPDPPSLPGLYANMHWA